MGACIIITGPTGVGKTEFIDHIAQQLPIEVINADVGQMYTPLSIGTAKPDWRNADVPHHLFDLFDVPRDCSVAEYRNYVIDAIHTIYQRGNIPTIVGGSLFYVKGLFFPPPHLPHVQRDAEPQSKNSTALWNQLYRIDPERANAIHPHDTYRIKRALAIWNTTGEKPSTFQPQFSPVAATASITCVTRERDELYRRIDRRVREMLDEGWITETEHLSDEWKAFLQRKHIIGYPDIIEYLNNACSYDTMIDRIQQKTRAYAKRQLTFWRSFSKQMTHAYADNAAYTSLIETVSLSDTGMDKHAAHIQEYIQAAYADTK